MPRPWRRADENRAANVSPRLPRDKLSRPKTRNFSSAAHHLVDAQVAYALHNRSVRQ